MLLTPNGSGIGDLDLTGQQAVEASGETGCGLGALNRRNEGIVVQPGREIELEGNHVKHGTVVKGDRIMITTFQRPDLRPTSVWVLGRENIFQPS